MDPNVLIVQHMLDRQQEIGALRAEVDRLTQESTELREAAAPRRCPDCSAAWGKCSHTGSATMD